MSSNLIITAAANAGKAVRGPTPPASSEDRKAFASMLSDAGDTTRANDARKPNRTEETEAGSNSPDRRADDPELIAAVVDPVVPIQAEPLMNQPLLGDLLNGLADLRAALEAGITPTPADLEKLSTALDALAEALGVSLESLPSMEDLQALATQPLAEGASLADQLSQSLAPLAETLLGATDDGSDTAATLKSLGEKLAALLQALETGEVDAKQLAALGLDGETSAIDPDLAAAIAKLTKPAAAPTEPAPAFAAAELKLSEPVLTGKSTPSTDTVAPTADTAIKVATDPKAGNNAGQSDSKSSDRSAPIIAAATVETAPDAQSTGQIGAQPIRVEAAASVRPIQAGYQTSQQQLNLPQLAFELVRQVNEGNTRFQIRLDPPELGRIDVRLDIDANGQVNARLTVEKAETLDLMQRDQRGLERALQQAGLDGAKTNLEFSLRQNGSGGNQQGQDDQGGRGGLFGNEAEAEDIPAPTVNLYRGSLTASGVNIIA
ncbi:hypothetical protein VW29_02435 [Devosia limi DSM 17137]|uniref:Flagellar hook-length control protein FliK n=1 Tax=Devosia limi DSM 17137 TaxID=1121477 RepID=A0A0F5LW69_9HYPH|nr:flagellar hook-length control protein FliK [Devosia limi]KKB86439.1 hypothetical protein VW29_02435 [Devosia limi DSM 17137]SHE89028.1 Flagellar hook-length control protein FliK [Devosia limi DSM 17137]